MQFRDLKSQLSGTEATDGRGLFRQCWILLTILQEIR